MKAMTFTAPRLDAVGPPSIIDPVSFTERVEDMKDRAHLVVTDGPVCTCGSGEKAKT